MHAEMPPSIEKGWGVGGGDAGEGANARGAALGRGAISADRMRREPLCEGLIQPPFIERAKRSGCGAGVAPARACEALWDGRSVGEAEGRRPGARPVGKDGQAPEE